MSPDKDYGNIKMNEIIPFFIIRWPFSNVLTKKCGKTLNVNFPLKVRDINLGKQNSFFIILAFLKFHSCLLISVFVLETL